MTWGWCVGHVLPRGTVIQQIKMITYAFSCFGAKIFAVPLLIKIEMNLRKIKAEQVDLNLKIFLLKNTREWVLDK